MTPSADSALPLPTLEDVFDSCQLVAIAVSGGVDSMMLAYLAHRHHGLDVSVFHAVSPAVPPLATTRVQRYAEREGWKLNVLDAGEFGDERYRANPANRCFYCKSNLYGALAQATAVQLLSGTNLDDLGDWRPGLVAAGHHAVRHPFVEAGLTKAAVRALAHAHHLEDLAELPAAPCLSSRVETGIRIDASALRSIDRTEVFLRETLDLATVRCRLRREGLVIELDAPTLARLSKARRAQISQSVLEQFPQLDGVAVAFQAYQRGSAFLRDTLARP